jgi:preprotein translocase subunit SecD
MRARVLCFVLTLAALGGCQSTPAPPSATTPKPGPDTPHETLRIRPVLVDPTNGMPDIIDSISPSRPLYDPTEAAPVRQAPRMAEDPSAENDALASLDCKQPDPLKGRDDPALPLAACSLTTPLMYALGPSVLNGDQAVAAGYRHDDQQDTWILTLKLTPAAHKAFTAFIDTHAGAWVAALMDGRVWATPGVTARPDGEIELSKFGESDVRHIAPVLNNH